MFDFFKKRKYHVIAFGEIHVRWMDATFTVFCVMFFENNNGKRKWTVSGGDGREHFSSTQYKAACEIWRHTGLLPEWTKDPIAEKLSR